MIEQYLAAFNQHAAQWPSPGWLATKRQQAIEAFAQLGFPTNRDEHWKYTRLTPLEKDFFAATMTQGSTDTALAPLQLITETATHRLVFIDGLYVAQLSQILPTLPATARLWNIQTALQNPEIALASLWDKTLSHQWQHFRTLNTAFMTDGAYIEIPDATTIAEPIELVFINSSPHCASHLRNIICLGKQAKATIIERYISHTEDKTFTNRLSELFLAEQAQLNHYLIQQQSDQAIHMGATQVQQSAHSQFTSYALALKGHLIRTDISVALLEEFAHCTLKGLTLAAHKQHIDFHTHIDHLAPNGQSRELYKGIISDRARGVFNGKIQVHPGAQKTDAQLSNQNLLLSKYAEIDTKPELEIYADDVKCSHGATVGQLDETSLFYLRSRGIDLTEAQSILTYAFAEDVIQDIAQEAIRQPLHQLLVEYLFK